MDGDGVGSLFEEDAVVADSKTQEALEFAGQWLDAAGPSLGVAVDLENGHGDRLRNGADLGRYFRLEVNLFHGTLQALLFLRSAAANLIHGEAQLGYDLLERDARTAVAEVLVRGTQRGAIFLG